MPQNTTNDPAAEEDHGSRPTDTAVQMKSAAHFVHTDAVLCIALCGDIDDTRAGSVAGRCSVSGGVDHRVAVTFPMGKSQTIGHHRGAVSCVIAGAQGSGLAVSGSHDRELRIWNVAALRRPTEAPKAGRDQRRSRMLHQRRKAVSQSAREAGALVAVLRGHTGSVLALASLQSSSDGEGSDFAGAFVSAAHDGTLRCWDVRTAACTAVLEHGTAPVTCCASFPAGATPDRGEGTVYSGSRDSTICLWNMASQGLVRRLDGHSDWVTDVQVGVGDGLLFSASRDGCVRVWDARCTQPCVAVCTGHSTQVNRVLAGVGSVGMQLGSASDDATIRIWDLRAGGRCCVVFRGHSAPVTGLVGYWGQLVSSSGDATMKMWDVGSGNCLRTFYGHSDAVSCLATDGTALVSGSWDSVVRMWA